MEDWSSGVTSGVPQLLCPVELVAYWEGINSPSNGRIVESSFRASNDPKEPATDYDLACAISMLPQEAGLVPIANGKALVICGEIPFAAWVSATDFLGGYILVPEFWTEAGPDCQSILLTIHPNAYSNTGLELVSTEGFVLFAATDCMRDSDFESIKADCPAGIYQVGACLYDTAEFQLRIIRVKAA
ncbi:hypothetical protein J4D97_08010 [Hymenobacter defluvii]|uniref:Uncharacterized protein n=1 Tax=Hymenobacter defluvii TaxID=2054411 RepID=A0ABS3TAB3_9BACT|nr:hypothetical protein [Hymenobacter defluvii]